MTYAEFYARIENFPNRFSNRSLASYLSALHALTEARQAGPFTAELCLNLLERAFTAESVPFDAAWPVIRTAPADTEYAPFDYACAVMRFQAAELHRMGGGQTENGCRDFSAFSETGHAWYNFDPFSLLECGARGMADLNGEEAAVQEGWDFLGRLLEMGRVYE